MIAIKDYKAIYEYRNRRQNRIDGKRLDDEWKTIKGTHVMVDDEGSISKGPERLRNLSSKKEKNLTNIKKASRSYDKWASGLSSEEKDAVRKYVALGHSRMFNDKLRTGKDATRGQASPDEYKALDSALEKSTIPEEMTLYRGTSEKMFGGRDPKDMIGETIVDNGYESTSMTGKVGGIYSDGVLCEINAPKGSKGAYVDEVGFGEKSDFGEDANNEILLPRNSQFKITGVETDSNGRTVVKMDYLGQREELSVGKEMSPINSDYAYEDGDTEDDFTHKNIKKLKPIYDEYGIEACHDEWYKFRMADSTKDIHQISKDEADEVMYDNVRQSIYDGWFRAADSSYKPQLTDAVVKNPEMRNAALNLAYENYRNNTDNPLPFEEFLVTPIKMYRGEKGQKHVEDDIFDAYTFDKKMASHFAGSNGTVTETSIRPIDTYGSMRAVGEAEIWVPRQLSPVGYKGDSREDGITWERFNPIKWALEDYKEEDDGCEDLLDSIIQEAEIVKLFDGSSKESDRLTMHRCIESIQIMVLQLTAKMRPKHEDSAFFAGELNSNLGERNILYPEVRAFRERRQKRLDAKNDEDEGRWITTENNHKVHLNEEGEPDKGNPRVIKAMESGPRVGSTAKREFGKRLMEIISSGDSAEDKTKKASEMLNELPVGTRVNFPDSWTSDDGTKNYATYEGEGRWRFRYGRGKSDTSIMGSEELGGYMTGDDESERATLVKIPGEKKERVQPSGGGKHKHDGTVIDNHVSDFHNDQVTQEDRDFLKDAVGKSLDYGSRKYDYYDRRKFCEAGKTLSDEIKRRHKLRKKDPDDVYDGDEPQVEDIYEALRDVRPFGTPDGFDKISYDSCLSEERTKAIIKEATDRFPSGWYEAIENGDVKVFIHDMSGRANFSAGGSYSSSSGSTSAIHLYAKEDPEVLKHLGEHKEEFKNKCDVALVNELAHELGHYMEWANPEVQDWARRTLTQRTEKSEEEYLEPGYTTKADKFFTSYMGKQYPYGYTEITSCLMQRLGYLNPFEVISGKDFGASSKDPESLRYILGLLGGL